MSFNLKQAFLNFGKAGKAEIMAKLTPIKAIRAKCLDCSNGQFKEVRLCPIKNCPLYEYRNGHRPIDEENIMENGTDEKVYGQGGTFQQERAYLKQ